MDPELYQQQQDALRYLHEKAMQAKLDKLDKLEAPRKSAEYYVPPHEREIDKEKDKRDPSESPLRAQHRDMNPCRELLKGFLPTHLHLKTGNTYRLLHIGRIEATMQKVAIYESRGGIIWVRPLDEFMDGRFQEIYP